MRGFDAPVRGQTRTGRTPSMPTTTTGSGRGTARCGGDATGPERPIASPGHDPRKRPDRDGRPDAIGGIMAPRTLIRAPGYGSPPPAPRTGPQSGTAPPRRLSCRHAFGPIQPLAPLKPPLDVSLYN